MKNLAIVAAISLALPAHSQVIDFQCELPPHELNHDRTTLEPKSSTYRVKYSVRVFGEDDYQVWADRADQLEIDPFSGESEIYFDHHFGTCCASSDEYFNVELHYGGAVAHYELKELISIYNLDFQEGSAQFSLAGAVSFGPQENSGEASVSGPRRNNPTFEPYLRLGTCKFVPMENPVTIALETFATETAGTPAFCDTIRGVIKNTDQLPETSKQHHCFKRESEHTLEE